MYAYLIGKIVFVNKHIIVLENNFTGYCINITNANDYELGKIKKVYIYKSSWTNNKNKLVEELYGFLDYQTKDFYMKLINLNGIGCKIAMNICSNSITLLKQLIFNKDVNALTSLPGITPKLANILINDLIIENSSELENNSQYGDVILSLKSLGYSDEEISYAIKIVDFNNELPDIINTAIRSIANR